MAIRYVLNYRSFRRSDKGANVACCLLQENHVFYYVFFVSMVFFDGF